MTWRVLPTPLGGVMLLEPEPTHDARGSFTRLSCVATLAEHGILFASRQTSLSRSAQGGTLRGLHFQLPPSDETKIVHCVAGAIFDVALDLRSGSPTFRRVFSVELSAENSRGLLIPRGCAHGMMTLSDDAAVLYQIDRDYDPRSSRGVRWNDPAFGIRWPMAPVELSDRDAAWPDFAP
jgi:dTDP-4-dehydrorhamnose 3,5-epimerase